MPFTEVFVMITAMLAFFGSFIVLTSMFLSHRREMAQIKHGGANSEAYKLENTELKETVNLLQDRMAVLEQIATDPAVRTAREIEQLR